MCLSTYYVNLRKSNFSGTASVVDSENTSLDKQLDANDDRTNSSISSSSSSVSSEEEDLAGVRGVAQVNENGSGRWGMA